VWDKELLGMGYWFRGQHELLLVGTKGTFSPPPQPLRIGSVIREKRSNHSKKPPLVRNLIASWFPDARRIELFARNTSPGWDVWGNDAENEGVLFNV
jgi:N6-adenosine-specific RNA methylase IME4